MLEDVRGGIMGTIKDHVVGHMEDLVEQLQDMCETCENLRQELGKADSVITSLSLRITELETE